MMAALTLAASLLTAADLSDALQPQDAQCRVIHYAADGSRHEKPPTRAYSRPSGFATSSKSSGDGEARASSSVSASSSSSGGGAAVTQSDDGKRSITRSYVEDGCTVVIDERPTRGE